jgi:MarR family transcriptional regulator, lower aerobic nicotinate degradation pathway regulator
MPKASASMARSRTAVIDPMLRDNAMHTADLPAWPLSERPGFLARRLHQIHVALFMETCGAFDVTPVQYSLLSVLAERGPADQTTLAAQIALDRTTTTGALKRLHARGLIERGVSGADRRARLCILTQRGTALLARMEAAARQAHAATLEPLSAAEQATLLSLMRRIVDANSGVTGSPTALG